MEEQEVDLRDYIKVIIKRKRLILTVFFVAVITTAIVSFIMPKTYETTVTIENGYIGEETIIKKEDVREIIFSQEILEVAIEETGINIDVSKLRRKLEVEDLKGTSFFKVKVRDSDPVQAKQIAEAISEAYLAIGQRRYRKRVNLINERLKELAIQIETAEGNIISTTNLMKETIFQEEISKSETMIKTALLQSILQDQRARLSSLIKEKSNLELLLISCREFKIISPPLVPESPIKPKKEAIVAISGVLSLVLGVFLVFFIEYCQPLRQTKKE